MDAKEKAEARECLLRLYPNAPAEDVENILRRAWQRNSGRVGRTSKLTIEGKTHCAVQAHVRHRYSSYEQGIIEECKKQGIPRIPMESLQAIKRQVQPDIRKILSSWRGPQGAAKTRQSAQKVVAPKNNQGPQTTRAKQIPPAAPWTPQVVGVLAPIRNSGLNPVENLAPKRIGRSGRQQTQRVPKAERRKKLEEARALQKSHSNEGVLPKKITEAEIRGKRAEKKRLRALEIHQGKANGYKFETRKERSRRREAIRAELKKRDILEGESGTSKNKHRKRERLIEKMLKEPVNGFILEIEKERLKRIREAKAKGGKKSGVPGDSSIEPKPSATTVQTIVISDSDSEHEDPPMELSNNGGGGGGGGDDDNQGWPDYEDDISVQGGEDEDPEYIASEAEEGGEECGGGVELELELAEAEAEGGGEEEGEELWADDEGHEDEDWYGVGEEGGEEGDEEEVDEGDGSGEVIVEIDDDMEQEIIEGGSDEAPSLTGWYYDTNKSLVGNPRNETIEAEPPATKPFDFEIRPMGNPRNETTELKPPVFLATGPIDFEARQMEYKYLQALAARWRVVRNPPQQA